MVPVRSGGQQAFLLRDPQRLSRAEIVVPADLAYLLSLLDGSRTLREAQLGYVRRFGSLLTTERIKQLLDQLDEALLLDSERSRQAQAEIEAAFRARPTRAAAHAGQSYPESAAAFIREWDRRLASASPPNDFALDPRRPALILPHYDLRAAAEAYAAGYALLARVPPPEVVVILGIAHQGAQAPFTLTRKPFETPFGALEADEAIITRLSEDAPFDPFAQEPLHRDEHSVEFQAVLLHCLFRDRPAPPRIVPVLCGSHQPDQGTVTEPAYKEMTVWFLTKLREALLKDPRAIAVIASADLSHIGARFGQPPCTQVHLDLARRHDLALLALAQTGDAAGLERLATESGDRYNVCGLPAIYALCRLLPITQGRLLSYRQAPEPHTGSCVSFAALALR